MPILRTYQTLLSVRQLLPLVNSLGTHVAAKLAEFATDERTLTDDLCDMFFIWAQNVDQGLTPGPGLVVSQEEWRVLQLLPDQRFNVTISKISQQEEATVGADLAVRVTTPGGVKRALFQAKVYDPQDNCLRCKNPAAWDKLWGQLVLMRQRSDLAFFLIYVPATKLDAQRFGFGTWEQGMIRGGPTTTSSKFGMTLIPVDDLLDSGNSWRLSPPVTDLGDGSFHPPAISLGRLILEMLVCRRGKWLPTWTFGADGSGPISKDSEGYPIHYVPYREIQVNFENVNENEWERFSAELAETVERLRIT